MKKSLHLCHKTVVNFQNLGLQLFFSLGLHSVSYFVLLLFLTVGSIKFFLFYCIESLGSFHTWMVGVSPRLWLLSGPLSPFIIPSPLISQCPKFRPIWSLCADAPALPSMHLSLSWQGGERKVMFDSLKSGLKSPEAKTAFWEFSWFQTTQNFSFLCFWAFKVNLTILLLFVLLTAAKTSNLKSNFDFVSSALLRVFY